MESDNLQLNTPYKNSMTSEANQSTSFHTPVPHTSNNNSAPATPTYYRSRIFTPFGGDNPIVSSAAILLSLLNRLHMRRYFSDAFSLQNHLLHEIQVFENLAQDKGCNTETIRIARYVLCATLDEILLAAVWDKENIWDQERLLPRFEEDSTGSEKFFLLLERLMENPERHLHLLELMYICLSLGFEGKYHDMTEGKVQLDNLIDKLFHCITQIRGEQAPSLTSVSTHTTSHSITATYLPLWIFILSTTILGSVYIVFNYMLNVRAAPVAQTLQHILQNIQSFAL